MQASKQLANSDPKKKKLQSKPFQEHRNTLLTTLRFVDVIGSKNTKL